VRDILLKILSLFIKAPIVVQVINPTRNRLYTELHYFCQLNQEPYQSSFLFRLLSVSKVSLSNMAEFVDTNKYSSTFPPTHFKMSLQSPKANHSGTDSGLT